MWQRQWREKSDSELVAGCLNGEAAAWEALIGRYQAFIFGVALRSGLSSADADDIFQNVCLKLCLHLPSVRDHQVLTAWLGAVTRQECQRWYRRRTPDSLDALPQELPADTPAVESALLDEERLHFLRQGLHTLSPECQQLLELLYSAEPLSYADTAAQLGVPIGSIGPRRARCLERLKKKLEEQGL